MEDKKEAHRWGLCGYPHRDGQNLIPFYEKKNAPLKYQKRQQGGKMKRKGRRGAG
jgi:hypothetical protein